MITVHNLQTRSADRPSLKNNKNAGGSGHLSKSDGKTYCLDTGNTQAIEIKRQIITHNIPEIVSVRKYEVDVLGLQKTLKEHKKTNNQQIADELQVPKTMVEHWFRTDTYFSIPDKDIWLKLKELLEITTNEFDGSIMIFEQKESVFEKTNRVYDEDGIAPTLTTMSENERILVRGGKSDLMITSNYIQWDSSGKGNKSQGERAYFENGKSGTLSRGSDNSGQVQPKVLCNSRIRRLTPTECERLQTVKDNYTNHVSDSQRYKMLGNGWTIDVLSYIFSHINK